MFFLLISASIVSLSVGTYVCVCMLPYSLRKRPENYFGASCQNEINLLGKVLHYLGVEPLQFVFGLRIIPRAMSSCSRVRVPACILLATTLLDITSQFRFFFFSMYSIVCLVFSVLVVGPLVYHG
ncbi:unnamed protein product [Pylaiella littoralis]